MSVTINDLLQIGVIEARNIAGIRDARLAGVSTDSRSIGTGEVFFALKGESFDGEKFVSAAFAKGALCAVVGREAKPSDAEGKPMFVVDDTTLAYGRLARLQRRKFPIPVIAVAGSNGKTTTKELLSHLLSTKYRVLSTRGNLNNQIGVPQTLLRLNTEHEMAVVEIGTNHPGELEYLCSILEPTHGLITNIGREHMEFFKTLPGVARAEGELFRSIGHSGTGYVNTDDRNVVRQGRVLRNVIRYGTSRAAVDVRGSLLGFDRNARAKVCINRRGATKFSVTMPVPGRHSIPNGIAAITVALSHGVSPARIRDGLRSFGVVDKRMEIFRIGGVTVMNDTYNANPDSVLAALDTGLLLKRRGEHIAVLGDMLELGPSGPREHQRIGHAVVKLGYDRLLTYGELARRIHEGAKMKNKKHYETKNELAQELLGILKSGDLVLIKGSRGMNMEDIVNSLQERLS